MNLRFWKKLWPWKKITELEIAAGMTDGSAALAQEKRIKTIEDTIINIWIRIRTFETTNTNVKISLSILKNYLDKILVLLKTGDFNISSEDAMTLLGGEIDIPLKIFRDEDEEED